MPMPYHATAAGVFGLTTVYLPLLFYSIPSQPWSAFLCAQLVVLSVSELLLVAFAYRLAFHPLAKYPGPLVAALTDWWAVYWMASGDRHLELAELHRVHGEFVRYGPSRMSLSSAEALRDINELKANVVKADIYAAARHIFGADMSMTTVDPKEHAFLRRVNSAALTPTAIRDSGGRVTPHVDILMQRLSEGLRGGSSKSSETSTSSSDKADDVRGWGPPHDMSRDFAYCVADIMAAVTFSINWNVQTETNMRQMAKEMPLGVCAVHLAGHMQSLFTWNMHKIVFRPLIARAQKLTKLAESWARWRMSQKGLQGDIFASLLRARDPVSGEPLPDDKLVSEATLYIVAGTDTVITTLSATLFYLLHNPRTLARLTREVRDAYPLPDAEGIRGPGPGPSRSPVDVPCPIRFASQELRDLTFMSACIDEAMRITPPVPGPLPRRVCAGGALVDGEFFPEGINLGVPAFVLHRDPEHFPDPLAYVPERWMPGEGGAHTGGKSAEQMKPGVGHGPAFTPFGAGRSSCLGKNLAYHEMSYILARLVWLYDMRVDSVDKKGEGMCGRGHKGRGRWDEFQTFDRFVSSQDGPVVQFRFREELRG